MIDWMTRCVQITGCGGKRLTILAFLMVLTAVAIVDWKTMEIPDGFHLVILAIGMVSAATMPEIPLLERIAGVFSASVPLWLITVWVSDAFGGGDIKLMAACGLMLGWRRTLTALFLAVLGGGLYGVYLLVLKKKGRKEHFAFGPFLCVGMAIALLWGDALIGWYLSFYRI